MKTSEQEIPKTPIEIASHEIWEKYINLSWFQAVGIADNELIIYTNIKNAPKQLSEYNGFPITYKYMGKIKPQ